jgi:hypothetical protein
MIRWTTSTSVHNFYAMRPRVTDVRNGFDWTFTPNGMRRNVIVYKKDLKWIEAEHYAVACWRKYATGGGMGLDARAHLRHHIRFFHRNAPCLYSDDDRLDLRGVFQMLSAATL